MQELGEDQEEDDDEDDDDSFSAPMIDASYLRTDSHLNNGGNNGLGLSVSGHLSQSGIQNRNSQYNATPNHHLSEPEIG